MGDLAGIPLRSPSQEAGIMLQRLADILLRLIKRHRLRDKLSDFIPTQDDLLPLVRLLLLHD